MGAAQVKRKRWGAPSPYRLSRSSPLPVSVASQTPPRLEGAIERDVKAGGKRRDLVNICGRSGAVEGGHMLAWFGWRFSFPKQVSQQKAFLCWRGLVSASADEKQLKVILC